MTGNSPSFSVTRQHATKYSCLLNWEMIEFDIPIDLGGASMKNTMEYKGYIGSVELSEEDGLFFGKVQGIRSLISYEGTTAKKLVSDFHETVDDYLRICEKEGRTPEVPYKGSLNIRFKDSETHKRADVYAISTGQSLNSFIESAVLEKLEAVKA